MTSPTYHLMGLMKIATYNVNGVNGRLEGLIRWLQKDRPDIVGLQELKTVNEKFPFEKLESIGYGSVWHGEKGFNGVAILARDTTPVLTRVGLPGPNPDPHSRYIEAAVAGILIGCLYLPNGNPVASRNFDYKLDWYRRFNAHAEQLLALSVPTVLLGDFNTIPTDRDVYAPQRWRGDALFRPEVRKAYADLLTQGWTDALRHLHPEETLYSFWKYWRNSFERNAGLRIDHILVDPTLAGTLRSAEVRRAPRGWNHASDHAPVMIEVDAAMQAIK
jgi:exodeoxyribonuclease-3